MNTICGYSCIKENMFSLTPDTLIGGGWVVTLILCLTGAVWRIFYFIRHFMLRTKIYYLRTTEQSRHPTNDENRHNVFSYMSLHWNDLLAIMPTLGRFLFFCWTVISINVRCIFCAFYCVIFLLYQHYIHSLRCINFLRSFWSWNS